MPLLAVGRRHPAVGRRHRARRRSWPRRFVRGVVGLGLLLVLLLALVLTFLHTPAGSTTARVLLEQWGSRAIAGKLRLGNLELHLWKGEAAATAASFSLEGVAFDAQRVELDWSSKSGPHVRLLRPRIVVSDTGRPSVTKTATGLAAQPWRALERLAGVEVEDGRLELRDAKGQPWLVLGRFDAEMVEEAGRRGRRRLSVRVTNAGLGWPDGGVRVRPASAEAALTLEDGHLAVEQARVQAGESSVNLRGRIDRISPITATVSAGVVLDGAFVEGLVPTSVRRAVDHEQVGAACEVRQAALRVRHVGRVDQRLSTPADSPRECRHVRIVRVRNFDRFELPFREAERSSRYDGRRNAVVEVRVATFQGRQCLRVRKER